MSKMSEMHAAVTTLSEKFGFDLEEAFRALELDTPAAAPAPKVKMVPMLDGQKVKRPQSSYLLYCASVRAELKEANPEAKVTDLAKLMGANWKELDAEGRTVFEAQANTDKLRYAEELSRAEMVPEEKKKRRAKAAPKAKAKEAAPAPPQHAETDAVPPQPALVRTAATGWAPGAEPAAEVKESEPAPTLSLVDPVAEPEAKAKASPKAKIPLPFCGQTIETCCTAIRKNHGLYTQCMMGRVGGEHLCKTCLKKKDALPYGTVADRTQTLATLGLEPTRYREVIDKMAISRDQAEGAAAALGWTIPETEFEEAPKKKTKRAKKAKASAAVESTDEDEPKPKGAGRPKKDARVVTTAKDGDDLITALIQNAEEEAFAPTQELEEEEPLEVVVFEHEGTQYLRSKAGAVFDKETEEELGKWDEAQQRIVAVGDE